MVFWNNSLNYKHLQIYAKEELKNKKEKELQQLKFKI